MAESGIMYLVRRKRRKMWRAVAFSLMREAYGQDVARDVMKTSTNEEINEFLRGWSRALMVEAKDHD